MKKKISDMVLAIINEWKEHKVWIIIAGVVILLFIYYVRWKTTEPPQYIKVPEIKEVVKYKIKRVEVPVEKIVVLEKDKIIKHVKNLPEEFVNDTKKQVTSTAELKPSKAGYDVMNIIDTETGISEIYAREHRLPFFGFENQGEVGIRVGLSDAGREIDVYAQRNFVRVGSFHIGGYVEGSYRPDSSNPAGWKTMAVLSRQW